MRTQTPLEQNLLCRSVVGDILLKSAARHPNRRVLRFRDRNYTYRALNETVNRSAHGLRELGICKGERVALLAHNSDHFIILWWASTKIGAVITPVNWMLRAEEIRYIVEHAEARAFFVEDALVRNVLRIQDALLDRWREVVPGVTFMNSYGQTEMTPLGSTISGVELGERPDSVGRSMLPVELKTGGENVASADVEVSLFRHPKVSDAAVVGLPSEVWGEAITAFVVPAPGEDLEEEEVIAWCKENMARYKVPKKVIFLNELPRNPTGKVLKRNLRKDHTD
jgi:acyl-CoA synthetase (AMP-forming)/AMP-acid ligase II